MTATKTHSPRSNLWRCTKNLAIALRFHVLYIHRIYIIQLYIVYQLSVGSKTINILMVSTNQLR